MADVHYLFFAKYVFREMEKAGPVSLADRLAAAAALLKTARSFTRAGLMRPGVTLTIRGACRRFILDGFSTGNKQDINSLSTCEKVIHRLGKNC